MRKFRKFRNPQEASNFLGNFITVATANLPALTTLVNADIIALTTLKTDIDAAIADAIAKQEAAEAAIAFRNTKLDLLNIGTESRVLKVFSIVGLSTSLQDQLGLPAFDIQPTPVQPITPTGLAVLGFGDGTNKLSWNTAGNAARTNYIIEFRVGPTGPWQFLNTTTRSKYDHTGQTPGVRLEYRVKAKRPAGESNYSNIAVVYG